VFVSIVASASAIDIDGARDIVRHGVKWLNSHATRNGIMVSSSSKVAHLGTTG
jgi:hypothetical protein